MSGEKPNGVLMWPTSNGVRWRALGPERTSSEEARADEVVARWGRVSLGVAQAQAMLEAATYDDSRRATSWGGLVVAVAGRLGEALLPAALDVCAMLDAGLWAQCMNRVDFDFAKEQAMHAVDTLRQSLPGRVTAEMLMTGALRPCDEEGAK